jgi:hypothetical protein
MNIFQQAVRDDDKEELWIKQLDQVESVYVAIPKGITPYSILFKVQCTTLECIGSGLTKFYEKYMRSMHLSEAKIHCWILEGTSQVVCT